MSERSEVKLLLKTGPNHPVKVIVKLNYACSRINCGLFLFKQQTEPESETTVVTPGSTPTTTAPIIPIPEPQKNAGQPKRLHVSNIPFRFRDPDLRAMFGVSLNTIKEFSLGETMSAGKRNIYSMAPTTKIGKINICWGYSSLVIATVYQFI